MSMETSTEAHLEASDMNVEVLSTEIIKPSSPTPDRRRNFALSLFDQLTPALYIPIILYYPTRDPRGMPSSADNLRRLRSSLSVVLTHFYPLAGRTRDNLCIDCDDQGAKFVEAKVNRVMSEVMARPNPQLLRLLLPAQVESLEARTGHLLLVQANSFECGGLAVGICISHKVADASSMSTFIKYWADVAADDNENDLSKVESLELNASSLVPPFSHFKTPPEVEFPSGTTVMKRYVFDSSSLAALMGEITSGEDGARPTRIEALSALLWKCLRETSRRIRGYKRRSFFSHVVNLRGRLPQPFPKDGTSLGNLLGGFRAEITEDDADIHLTETARRLRLAKEDYFENFVKKEMVGEKIPAAVLGGAKAFGDLLSDTEVDFYNCTSWCKFPLYEADFGWGKPSWAVVVGAEFKDAILMIDGRGGDEIEVWVSLEHDHMAEFEREEDLLRFASPNPCVT